MIRPGVARGQYPLRIRLSETAETYIDQLTTDLVVGAVELWQLPQCLADLFNLGHHYGAESLRPELDAATHAADRYYAEMCRRPAPLFIAPNRPSFATLERIRGNDENADRIDAANARRFGAIA